MCNIPRSVKCGWLWPMVAVTTEYLVRDARVERERLQCSGERGRGLTMKVKVFWGEGEREMIVGDGGDMGWVVVTRRKEK